MQNSLSNLLQEKHIKALILDLDGVITQTAKLHSQAWKKMFDVYLERKGRKERITYLPLTIATDYRQLIDGIPRYDGVRNFLESRNIHLPEGDPDDEPGKETIAGLGNLKNQYFQEFIKQGMVDVYPDTVNWLKQQRRQGLRTAVISASKNCEAILTSVGLMELFDVRVDGVVSAKLNLKGKPAPDIFLEAARQLGIKPHEAAVFEDALAGVQAGKVGQFAIVVGIDRTGDAAALKQHGADLVIQNFPTE